jgi:hypothetical protein
MRSEVLQTLIETEEINIKEDVQEQKKLGLNIIEPNI